MTKEIEQGAWGHFEKEGYPEDVSTGGMGPCTGIMIFEPNSGAVYGAHLVSPHLYESDVLEEMLCAAKQAFLGVSDIKIWVSGCCELKGVPDYQPPIIRKHVETAVRNAFPNASHDFHWPPKGVSCVDMTLNPESGECDIQFSDHP